MTYKTSEEKQGWFEEVGRPPLHEILNQRCDNARQMELLRARYGMDYEQPTAVPMLTGGYNLPAKHVIHIVGPIVQGGLTKHHEEQLASCYSSCLKIAEENDIKSIAFCCISTGVFMFSNQRAAEIAVETVMDYLKEHDGIEKVVFNVFKDMDLEIYDRLLNQ